LKKAEKSIEGDTKTQPNFYSALIKNSALF